LRDRASRLCVAIETAAHYGLYDLDRVERISLKNVTTAYFVVPADRVDSDQESSESARPGDPPYVIARTPGRRAGGTHVASS
jgi:hypothetical protein